MAIKKSELYSTLWASCDKLRGGMDASQYKDYVLVLLFVKYVSDKYSTSTEDLIKVPEGGSFSDLVALKHNKDIGQGINGIISKLAEANGLTGIITQADFNDEDKLGKGKEMQDKLSDLITIFENPELDFSKNRADGDDILGDAYEYLMRHFAAESGKSKGQFYTPAEVSRIMAKILGINESNSDIGTSAYDPTCGSGSLLLKVAEEAGKTIRLYGQEKEVTTAGLAQMNMILHNNAGVNISKGQSTISSPLFLNENGTLMQFDYAVSNPPFSSKNWTDGFNPYQDAFGRFSEFGVPPAKNGDYAFLLHIIHSLKENGKGAIVLPLGILFRAYAEEEIRKKLISKGYIKGIIGLPLNLFYGTSIPACIIVVDKENTKERDSIFIIDASKGYIKDGNKNRLREQDIKKIVDAFTSCSEIPKFSRNVPLSEIEANDFNLNITRYVDSQEETDMQDIEAHLLGDIPDGDIRSLRAYWEVYPSLKNELFEPGKRAGYSRLKVSSEDIRPTVFRNSEFKAYAGLIDRVFLEWKEENLELLKNLGPGMKPKVIIRQLSESLLNTFANRPLIDNYDIYQHLMTYWNETMQDDLYTIVSSGWSTGKEVESNGRKKDWEGRLVPRRIIIETYYPDHQEKLSDLEAERTGLQNKLEAFEEEYGGDEGLLADVLNDKGKIHKTLVARKLKVMEEEIAKAKEIKIAAEPNVFYGPEKEDEASVLKSVQLLIEQESAVSRKVKEAGGLLDKYVAEHFSLLTEEDIKTLVIEKKWMGKLQSDLRNEMEKISHKLAERIRELADRYENTLPHLIDETNELAEKVRDHLKQMGFEWN